MGLKLPNAWRLWFLLVKQVAPIHVAWLCTHV